MAKKTQRASPEALSRGAEIVGDPMILALMDQVAERHGRPKPDPFNPPPAPAESRSTGLAIYRLAETRDMFALQQHLDANPPTAQTIMAVIVMAREKAYRVRQAKGPRGRYDGEIAWVREQYRLKGAAYSSRTEFCKVFSRHIQKQFPRNRDGSPHEFSVPTLLKWLGPVDKGK